MLAISSLRVVFNSYRALLAGLLSAGLFVFSMSPSAAQPKKSAAEPLRVVASFSILGDMVSEIGGEHVALSTIVGPGGDAHTFEPAPKDVLALANAQVLVLNGLDFEGWLPRLIKASGFKGQQILASDRVKVRLLNSDDQVVLGAGDHAHDADHGHDHDSDHAHDHANANANASGHDHNHAHDHDKAHDHAHDHAHSHAAGDVDPHAWQDLSNGIIYATNIAEGLSRADPANSASYRSRADIYIKRMQKLDAEIKAVLKDIPKDRRTVITTHDAFGYFAQAYGIRFISVAGFSSAAEPSAKDLALIIDNAKKHHVSGVFFENISSNKIMDQIARETGAKRGGTLYSDALASPGEPAGTYLGMFSWNAGRLIRTLKP
ncbi:metal ABC transporter substrate-binding protein [Allopusillimonas ginsengisoli]|nr:metal ABC transporter substrate-binding protein [Allopusillimonas ginsengisoli]